MTPQQRAEYERFFRDTPFIAWREPIKVVTPRGSGLGCRMCIAMRGFRIQDAPTLFQAVEEFERHLEEDHRREA